MHRVRCADAPEILINARQSSDTSLLHPLDALRVNRFKMTRVQPIGRSLAEGTQSQEQQEGKSPHPSIVNAPHSGGFEIGDDDELGGNANQCSTRNIYS